jgi:hypothetical protein
VITAFAVLLSVILGIRATFLPPTPNPVKISVLKHGQLQGRFALLMVTTLERLLLGSHSPEDRVTGGALQLIVVESSSVTLVRALICAVRGRLGRHSLRGVHLQRSDEIRIEGEHSNVILDGELFEASLGHPIVLKGTAPVPFLRLAA